MNRRKNFFAELKQKIFEGQPELLVPTKQALNVRLRNFTVETVTKHFGAFEIFVLTP